MLLAVPIWSYGCIWEVWRALKKLEFQFFVSLAMPRYGSNSKSRICEWKHLSPRTFPWRFQFAGRYKEEFCGPFCGDFIWKQPLHLRPHPLFPHTQSTLKHRIRDGPLWKLIDWKQNGIKEYLCQEKIRSSQKREKCMSFPLPNTCLVETHGISWIQNNSRV